MNNQPINNQEIASAKKLRKDLRVPKLRFKEFDGDWEQKKLISKIDFIAGYAFKSSQMKGTDSKYQLLKMSNVYKSKLQIDRNASYWENIDKKLEKYLLKQKDILLTLTGTVGKRDYGYSIVIPEDNRFLLNQRLVCLRAKKNESDADFVNNIIKTSRFYYLFFNESKGGTGNQTNVGIEDLRNIKLSFPNLQEQQKIATFLTAVDDKIQQLTQKKTLLAQYKKGAMQQIFSQQLRFKTDAATSLRGNEAISSNEAAFPYWEEKKLGEIAIKNSIKNKKNEVNFVLTNSATQGIVSQQDYFDRDIANKNNLEGYYIVEKDDFVYNPRISVHAPVGPIKRNKLQRGVMSPLYSVFRFSEDILEYFEFYFETVGWHIYLNSVANFGARHDRMNISSGDFFKMPIPMPCKEERKKIATYLSAIDKKIENVQTQIAKTQTFKKGLLQQMFI
jgi:type I restriction enzyme S subunit